jgi:hypothetical protein
MLRIALVAFALASSSASATVGLTDEEFRLYCGYLDALQKPDIAKLKDKARDTKIAKLAKVKPAVLSTAVERGQKAGSTCDEIGKLAQADAKAALDKALPGRVYFFELDTSDPSHVVASVGWLGIAKPKLVEEAALVAATIAEAAPMAKTIAMRGADPSAADKTVDAAGWFDAKITGANAKRIRQYLQRT